MRFSYMTETFLCIPKRQLSILWLGGSLVKRRNSDHSHLSSTQNSIPSRGYLRESKCIQCIVQCSVYKPLRMESYSQARLSLRGFMNWLNSISSKASNTSVAVRVFLFCFCAKLFALYERIKTQSNKILKI